MLPALSLEISANWCWMMPSAWLQAKSAFAGPVLFLASSACRARSFPGKADAERAPERRTMIEVSCILGDYLETEMPNVVIDLHHVLLQATYQMILIRLSFWERVNCRVAGFSRLNFLTRGWKINDFYGETIRRWDMTPASNWPDRGRKPLRETVSGVSRRKGKAFIVKVVQATHRQIGD